MFDIPMIMAQAPIPEISGWFDYLLSQGVLGFMVLALGWFLIKKDKQINEITENRLKDIKEMSEVIKRQTVAMEASIKMDEQDHQAIENYSRLIDKQMIVLDQLIKTVNDLDCK